MGWDTHSLEWISCIFLMVLFILCIHKCKLIYGTVHRKSKKKIIITINILQTTLQCMLLGGDGEGLGGGILRK